MAIALGLTRGAHKTADANDRGRMEMLASDMLPGAAAPAIAGAEIYARHRNF